MFEKKNFLTNSNKKYFKGQLGVESICAQMNIFE